MEKYQENINNAIKNINIADHMIYVTYPLVKEKKLLLSSIDRIYDALMSTINAILQYDYVWKRIKLYQDPKDNFEVFLNKCAKHYGLNNDEIAGIFELISIVELHKKSPMEFLRREKIVILTDNLQTKTIDSNILKHYLTIVKSILNKTRIIIK
jgi:hypothetical protein